MIAKEEKEKIAHCRLIRNLANMKSIYSMQTTGFNKILEYFGVKHNNDTINFFQAFFSHIQPFMLFTNFDYSDNNHFKSYIMDIYTIYFHIENNMLLVIDNIDMNYTRHKKYLDKEISIIKDTDSIIKNGTIRFFIPKGLSVFEVQAEYYDSLGNDIFIIDYACICEAEIIFANNYMLTFSKEESLSDTTRIETLIRRIFNDRKESRKIIQDIVLSTMIECYPLQVDKLISLLDTLSSQYSQKQSIYLNRVHKLIDLC